MQIDLEPSLERWVGARILDARQAESIREFERRYAPSRRARWPVLLALAFGGLMLGAGVLLFVSAHWDRLSPAERTATVLTTLAALHTAAAFSRNSSLGMVLHAVGTVALGGAISVLGQTFNLEEHWSGGVMLWAGGAWIAWFVLRQWPQLTLAAILTPVWLIGKWLDWASPGWGSESQMGGSAAVLIALCYLSARLPGYDSIERRSLAWVGGLGIIPAVIFAATETLLFSRGRALSGTKQIVGWAGAILLPLAVAWLLRGTKFWVNAIAAVWCVVLSWMAHENLSIPLYLWCALGSAGLIAWGVYEYRSERVNLGMAGFALSVISFFFSSVMDKLGRSASLVTLGILFLAGGWGWERLRRGLVARTRAQGAGA